MFANEFHCLSNTILQRCIAEELAATWGIVPAVRQLVLDAGIAASAVTRVELTITPEGQGMVGYVLRVCTQKGSTEDSFSGTDPDAKSGVVVLYDRARDGRVEFLRVIN